MKINIGSTNPGKIEALKETISDYDFISKADIIPIKVDSEVSNQPIGIEEITKGSINRAKNAFKDCKYSFGLESGLMKVPNTKTGYMDVSVCTIFDGEDIHLGLSSAFEVPKEVIRLVKEENMDLSKATHKTNLTSNPNIGSAEGIIGILTKGRVTRKDYTKQSIQMALIQIENKELY